MLLHIFGTKIEQDSGYFAEIMERFEQRKVSFELNEGIMHIYDLEIVARCILFTS
jgi:hypothetical protein